MPNTYLDRIIRSGTPCPECGILIDHHPKCEACGALLGHNHSQYEVKYRGLTLCGACVNNWQSIEMTLNYKISYQQFLSGNIELRPLSKTPVWAEVR